MLHKIQVIIRMLQDPWTWYFVVTFLLCYVTYKLGGKDDKDT